MRVEPTICCRLRVPPLALAVLGLTISGIARADPFFGHLQAQYQSVARDFTVVRSDGSIGQETFSRSWWVQNYELNYATQFQNRLQLLAQARFTGVSVNNRSEGQTIPEGSLRLTHREYGFTGRYRPITTTSTIGSEGVTGPGEEGGSSTARELKARNTELSLSAYVAPRNLPRLDLSWIRLKQDTESLPDEQTGTTRNARLGYDVGRLSLRGEYGDRTSESQATGQSLTIQNNLGGGAAFRVLASPGQTLNLRYDISQVTRLPDSPGEVVNRTHTAGLTGHQRFSRSVTGNINYNFRRTEVRDGTSRDINQQDGAIQVHYQPKRSITVTGATGVRTLPRENAQVAQQYLTASAGVEGRVLAGWTGQAGLAHTTNWTPGEPSYSVDNLRLASTFVIAPGLDLFGDASVANNTNPIASALRNTIQGSAGFRAVPLHNIGLDYRYSIFRGGPDFGRALSHSRNWRLSLSWEIVSTLQLSGDLSRAGAQPQNDPDLRTRSLNLRWYPSKLVQLTGSYARSDRIFLDPTANRLVGTEVVSLRWLSSIGRRWVFNANMSVSNPGDPTEARQFDTALTYSFGR